ncbi:MAG: S1C family serine protease [Defluviitaleaceae bacterium]|nr:S1C family serine protease [Defluviitaleaceae bacterium]
MNKIFRKTENSTRLREHVRHLTRVIAAHCAIGALILLTSCTFLREGEFPVLGQLADGPPATMPPVVTPPPPPPTADEMYIPEGVALTPAQIFAINQFAVFQIFAYHTANYGYWGSGFFICPTGIAVTNHHVLDGAGRAVAVMYDSTEFEIMGWHSYDFGNDLAIIQVDNRGGAFNYVALADSDDVRVGETIFAIGGPEGDTLTFTDGMVSRLVSEPVFFDGYTVSGMIQHTAAIYGGNSGGPLLNDFGRVIGINAAGRPDRASVQFAVPANRINMPAPNAEPSRLPLGRGTPWQPPQFDGQPTYLARFPFIPDIQSVSENARLIMSGTPTALGEEMGWLANYYEYLYVYAMPAAYWVPDTDAFDETLLLRGFEFQNIVHFDIETWVYFFHPVHNTSISYAFMRETNTLLVAIARGDAYTAFYHTVDEGYLYGDAPFLGGWEFIETTSDLYHEWASAGEHLYYTFFSDGLGDFLTTDDNGDIIRHFPFEWHIKTDTLVINYSTIDLTLIYRFNVYDNTLRLSSDDSEHLLINVG